MKCLREALQYDGQETPVLVFTGIGGMGKTALRSAFEEHFLKPNKVPYAVLDYDGDPNLRSIEATLRTIRRQLGRYKVKTPVFDFLYARYFELSTGVKISSKNCPPELEGVATILDGIPTVGNISQILLGLTQLGLRVKKRVQHKEWLHHISELEPKEVLNLLPEVLAEDLEEAMLSQTPKILKTSGSPISLLFDAYERISESQLDDTLHRKLLLLTPHLLRVIFTRDLLPWEHKFPMKWKDKIEHFCSLEDLCHKDAKVFLQKKSVDDPALQEYLYHLTNGYPFHLELCADICREIEETTRREPGIQDFEGAAQAKDLTEELVNRLLRQLKNDERDLMGLSAYPRWVSKEILEVLSSVPESVPRIFKKFIRLSMFSPHPEISKSYILRKEIRDCLLLQQRRKRLWKTLHERLSTFHRERWRATQSFQHIREALYHMYYENSEEAMKLFEEYFWKLLEKFSFGEAEGLLGSVVKETLSEKQKRKVDYARARLLTAISSSQQSLETAKILYESLIASETDEGAIAAYLFSLGKLLRAMSDYGKALEYFQKSLSISLKIYGEKHRDVADSYHNIGILYAEQSRYEKAMDCFQKGLNSFLKVYGEEHPTVASSYHNIGNIYDAQGEYGKALEYYQKGLAIRLKVYGEEHPAIANSYNNIGTVYDMQGKYGKALEFHHKGFAIWLKVYGEEHPAVAHSYHNIGNVYCNKNEYDKALEYYQKGLSIRLKVYGGDHPAVSGIYHNIAIIYRNKGEDEKALEYLQKSLDIGLKVYGEEHRDVAHSYHNIGIVYKNTGEYGKALRYLQKSLSISLKLYGEEHTDVAISYLNIGNIYSCQSEYEKAQHYYQKSLSIFLRAYGEIHPDVAGSYGSIAEVYKNKGKYKKALELHQKSLSIFLKVHGEEHPNIAESYTGIAEILWTLKKEERGLENMRKSIKIYRKFRLWKDAVAALETLAGWLEETGKNKEAEETRNEAERIEREKIEK